MTRYLKATWPKDFAYLDLRKTITIFKNMERDQQGTVQVDVPLATRHFANVAYVLKERRLSTTGSCSVDYNQKNVLKGKYNSKAESRAGFQKDVVDITVENNYKPIGVTYIHQVEGTGGASTYYVSLQ